jgi:hypothetical protein
MNYRTGYFKIVLGGRWGFASPRLFKVFPKMIGGSLYAVEPASPFNMGRFLGRYINSGA